MSSLVYGTGGTTGYEFELLDPASRFGIYKVEVAWSSRIKGVFTIDLSELGGPDGLGGTSYNSPFGGLYDDITVRSDNHVRVEQITWSRGRSDDLSEMQALRGSISVSDPTGMMNKNNPDSPLNQGDIEIGELRPLRPVRVTCYFNGAWHPVLFGFLRGVEFEPLGRTGRANLEISDLFTFLETPRKDQPNASPSPTIAYTTVDAYGAPLTTGGAIGLILDWLGWTDLTLRRLDAGEEIPFFEATGDKSALALIQEIMAPNLGVFYIDAAGVAVFEDRNTPLRQPVVASIANTMTALGSGISADAIRNKWSVVRQVRTGVGQYQDGLAAVAEDFVSSNEYGEKSDSLASRYIRTDSQSQLLADHLLAMTKDPASPLWRLEIDNREGVLMDAMLALDLHDKVVASEAETGTAGTFIVEQLSGSIDGRKHSVQYVLTDRQATVSPFIVGVDQLGGANVLSF